MTLNDKKVPYLAINTGNKSENNDESSDSL